ncbi:zinc finger protein 286A-like isoform X3 [Cottoperca gobio]|uniref:Zinc finger protein 286A-like isoform X3 n=1 Tax=Cottoperca gobio TaxID=56716 RepID=A0A6J2RHX7_COTGO|nr:zinc finger protein 286A-like isoform X3 [Cottoperca gobio]
MSKILTDHGFLSLSSLRLIVPPLQLVSVALWEIVKQGAMMYYGLLEEFVTTVLDTVPELLTYTERAQLVMGLRAKVVLELCRNDDFASLQAIQPHLSRLKTYITNQDKETSSSEVKASVTNFLKLVHTLLDDTCQRDIFYQKTFPTVFGPEYDSALQALMRKFLFNLQKLLPVPNLEQTSLWFSLSPSILKECVDFMNQPEPLHTLIQHHKQHGHKVPQASSSSGDDCILSSLSYHLPNVDIEERGALKDEGGALKDEKENFKETNSKLKRDVERDARQHVDDLTEDQGASVEVILQPSDESESNDNDDVGKKGFRHLKTASSTSSKTFNCLVCGQDFDSPSKLKKHQITQSGCCSKTVGPSNSADQNRFLEKLNLHPKPKTCVENKTSTSENKLSSTLDPSNLNSLANFEQSNDDDARLVCHVCDKVFTYPKSFDRHQRNCVVSRKRQAETDTQCSTSLPRPSKANPVVKTKDSSPSETEAGLSNVVPHESTSSDSKMKRSSRVKQCSVCGKTFTWCADLTRHMRSHTEQYSCAHCGKDFDSYEDCESHQEEKCRVSNQCSQDNSASNANIRNQENIVASSSITQIPSISNASANSQAKSPLTCQECGQGFTYSKSFEKHKSKCSQRAPKKRKERANENNFVINARHLRSAENTNAKASSEIKESESAKSPTSADNADGPQTKSRSIKCTLCENKFSEIVLMKRHYFTSHKVRTGSTSANQKLVPVLCLQQLLHKASSTK